MHDIHSPEGSGHSWKDYFTHISIVVIGLLIALGLDQTVEFFHHRHQAKEARELLKHEADLNAETVREEVYVINMHEDYLFRDLIVIAHARQHSLVPTDRIVLYRPGTAYLDTAWQMMRETGTLALLSENQLVEIGYMYVAISELESMEAASKLSLQYANTMFYASPADRFDPEQERRATPPGSFWGKHGDAMAHKAFEDQSPGPEKIARLTTAELDRLEQAVQEGIYQDETMRNRCRNFFTAYKSIQQ